MAKNDNLKDFLTDVADAIREKKGTEDLINPQDFSEEIKNLPSGSSPFAVDFGEEIATGNPAFINALQEDIDYYNEIQRKRASGEVTDAQLLKDMEFKRLIAWWPKGMGTPNSFSSYVSLRKAPNYTAKGYCGNLFSKCVQLQQIDNVNFTNADNLQNALQHTLLEEADLSLDKSTSIGSLFANCMKLLRAKIYCPLCTYFNGVFNYTENLEEAEISIDKATNVTNMFVYCFGLKHAKISGMAMSLSLSSSQLLSPYSVHYIISNAIGSTSAITLTLHATAKANWESSEYYAEDVVTANEKNITIA